jgi:hypothetical protein
MIGEDIIMAYFKVKLQILMEEERKIVKNVSQDS